MPKYIRRTFTVFTYSLTNAEQTVKVYYFQPLKPKNILSLMQEYPGYSISTSPEITTKKYSMPVEKFIEICESEETENDE